MARTIRAKTQKETIVLRASNVDQVNDLIEQMQDNDFSIFGPLKFHAEWNDKKWNELYVVCMVRDVANPIAD